MRLLPTLIVTAALLVPSFADEMSTKIQKGAQKVANALMARDWDTIVAGTYPGLVELIGGKEKMLEVLEQGIPKEGPGAFKVTKATAGLPGELTAIGKNRYALVPQSIVIKMATATVSTEGHLLAVSNDEGATWTYLDLAQVDDQKLAIVIPEVAGKITLPEKVQPVFVDE